MPGQIPDRETPDRSAPDREAPTREAPTREAFGWNAWFAERAGLQCGPTETAARVTAVDRGWLLLLNETGVFRAQLSGTFMHNASAAAARPCVGDWVCVARSGSDGPGGGSGASVRALLERKTSLRRRAIGNAVADQMIAANMDCVMVVQSCHTDFNLKRLERYLAMVAEGGATPWVLLTKTDLVEPEVLAGQIAQIRGAGITAPVLTLSNVTRPGATPRGIDELQRALLPGQTYCFVGSSGVGKSTLINALVGRALQATKSVSGTGEGRHTTVRRELIVLENGAMVIDNPGMREFGILGDESGVAGGFPEIVALAAGCRFNDCTHSSEPGCAVLAAVAAGTLDRGQVESFIKLTQESQSSAMSAGEKRKQARAAGRPGKSGKKAR